MTQDTDALTQRQVDVYCFNGLQIKKKYKVQHQKI